MKLVAFILTVSLAASSVAWAAPCVVDDASRATSKRSGLLCLDGVLGHWMPIEEARTVLGKVRLSESLRDEIAFLEARVKVEQKRSSLLQAEVGDLQKIEAKWREAALAQAQELARRERNMPAAVWFGIGAIAGIVSAIVGSVVIYQIAK